MFACKQDSIVQEDFKRETETVDRIERHSSHFDGAYPHHDFASRSACQRAGPEPFEVIGIELRDGFVLQNEILLAAANEPIDFARQAEAVR